MFSKIIDKIKQKLGLQTKETQEESIYYEFKEHLKQLLDILLSSYYIPQLKWYEFIVITIVGVLFGIGLGIITYSYFKYPQSVIIVNNGTIVKIPIR